MTDTPTPFGWQAPATFPTSAGPRLAAHPVRLVIPRDPAKALAFASQVAQQADFLLSEGRTRQAERLAHLALEARCRAAGSRA